MPEVLFRGETIRTADSLPPWALVEFGNAMGDEDIQITSPQGIRTLFELFEVLVVEDDWSRFRKAARRASEGELVEFIQNVTIALRGNKTTPSAPAEPTPAASINWG